MHEHLIPPPMLLSQIAVVYEGGGPIGKALEVANLPLLCQELLDILVS